MEGGSLAAGDFSEHLKQSNQELEEECVKLQDVVDKMVIFFFFFFGKRALPYFIFVTYLCSLNCFTKGKHTVKDGEDSPC